MRPEGAQKGSAHPERSGRRSGAPAPGPRKFPRVDPAGRAREAPPGAGPRPQARSPASLAGSGSPARPCRPSIWPAAATAAAATAMVMVTMPSASRSCSSWPLEAPSGTRNRSFMPKASVSSSAPGATPSGTRTCASSVLRSSRGAGTSSPGRRRAPRRESCWPCRRLGQKVAVAGLPPSNWSATSSSCGRSRTVGTLPPCAHSLQAAATPSA
mmetsp:Transcript_108792/g.307616  ORF Transcript_108792/g.307616 Transcript_108792/m.307616 type:complete len:213 (-) Transcript_108792:707-1345(-)